MNHIRQKNPSGRIVALLKAAVIMLAAFTALPAMAQKITGSVTTEDGEPVIGASVTIKGTRLGNTTDIDGKYEIAASGDATLEFSYVWVLPPSQYPLKTAR